jgi:S1-C subfamily serine protease
VLFLTGKSAIRGVPLAFIISGTSKIDNAIFLETVRISVDSIPVPPRLSSLSGRIVVECETGTVAQDDKIKIIEVMEKNLSLARQFDSKESIKVGDLISAKRVQHKSDNEIDRWNKIFGEDASKNESALSLSPSSQLTKRSLPVSSAEDIVNAYGKSVVLIQTDKMMGSGFVVSSDGLILSNSHVISGSSTISVKFIADNRVYSNVKVMKDNTIRDLALLKINDAGNFVPVVLGDSDQVSVGERVVAIGNPKGLENTVSDGLVSALRDMNGTKLIQISAPISSGSSGGALFNMNGEVIGITSASFDDGQNLNFAVSINHAKNELLP